MAKAKNKGRGDEAEATAEVEAKPRFETLRAVLWAAVIALAIRSFVVEPFKIPSGSMIPTLLVGDYVLVNKFAYGVRLPITGTLLFGGSAPRRGDVIVFRWPDDPRQDYIKRVIGLPGDRIEVIDRRLFINGQLVDRVDEGSYTPPKSEHMPGAIERYRERNPEGVEYTVLQLQHEAALPGQNGGPWIVPEGQYFMMGDNRDNSRDSRMWNHPFVTPEQIKGRAFMVHWSWVLTSAEQAPRDSFIGDLLFTVWRVITFQVEEIRWRRIGHSVSGTAD